MDGSEVLVREAAKFLKWRAEPPQLTINSVNVAHAKLHLIGTSSQKMTHYSTALALMFATLVPLPPQPFPFPFHDLLLGDSVLHRSKPEAAGCVVGE